MVQEWHAGSVTVPVHGLFVGLGVLAAAVVFTAEARRRGAMNDQSLVAIGGALVGGAIACGCPGGPNTLTSVQIPAWRRPGSSVRKAFSVDCSAPIWVC